MCKSSIHGLFRASFPLIGRGIARSVFVKWLSFLLLSAVGLDLCSGFTGLENKDGVVQVPFSFVHNVILVQAKIGGKGPFTMILDTDIDPSGVDLSFAKSIDLKLRSVTGEASGGGSEHPQAYLTKMPAVELHPLLARDLQAIAINLSQVRNRLGKDIEGVLGNNFLSGRVVQIDYAKGMLHFHRSSFLSLTATNNRVVLPFRFDEDDGCNIVEGVIINGKKIAATIDTGSDDAFKLTPTAVEDLGLTEDAAKGKPEESLGSRETMQNTTGKVDVISIGSITVNTPDVVFYGRGYGKDHMPWGVNVGNAFLKNYIVTIDYKQNLMALEKP
jgi:hypothetical protein